MKWLILAALVAVLVWMLTSRADKRRRGRHDDGGSAGDGSAGDSGSHDARRHDPDTDGGDGGSGGDGGGGGD